MEVPRAFYGALALALCGAVALMATGWGEIVAHELQLPAWAWRATKGCFIVFAAACGAQALWGRALVFDAQRAAIVRGNRVVAPFASVSHVELLEHRGQYKHRYWTLRVHLADGHCIVLGRESNDVEADLAAAHVATALGKPVRHVVR